MEYPDRDWMYTGRPRPDSMTSEWVRKIGDFLDTAFANGVSQTFCPCAVCKNRKRQNKDRMGRHLILNGFVVNYKRWTHHGESGRERQEVVRQRIDAFDAEAGVGDMLNDFNEAEFNEGRREEEHAEDEEVHQEQEPEPTAKAYFDMISAAQQPLRGHTNVSQLDVIARLMAVKSQFSFSRAAFDVMLTVISTLLPEGYYVEYACKTDATLEGWDVVYNVRSHGKLPVPNDADYNIDPNTYEGDEFYQDDGLPGRFEIDLSEMFEMEVDNEMNVDEDVGDAVDNEDIELLERLHIDMPPPPPVQRQEDIPRDDSDDDTYDPANPDDDDYF